MKTAIFALLSLTLASAAESVDPTFLHRYLPSVAEKASDVTTPGCRYRPLFGEGDAARSVVVGIARFGEISVDPGGKCAAVAYEKEEQVYVVLEGSPAIHYASSVPVPLKKEDFLYIPPSVSHSLENRDTKPTKVIVMGFRVDAKRPSGPAKPLAKANIEDVPVQAVSGHPLSAQYRLLMGSEDSKRDRIAAGRALTSLFVMEIAPHGTNQPHHHEREEEIYLVLDGHGEMAAGSGTDGVEGRYPAKAGDAYFFRLNCTVGFYSAPDVKSRILAVRSWYPGMEIKGMEH